MNKWLVTAGALGAAAAFAAAPGAIASLDEDPGTAARWHKRLASVVKAEFGVSSYHAAALREIERLTASRDLRRRDLIDLAKWWWSRLPSPGNKAYGYNFAGVADTFNQEWTFAEKETPRAAAAMAAFGEYYDELVRWGFVAGGGGAATGEDLSRVRDRLLRLCGALDADHNTEAPIDTPHGTDAGEVVGGFVDDVITPPLRAGAKVAGAVGGAAVSVANGVIDGVTSGVTSLVKGLGVTVIVTLGVVGGAGFVLWKYGGGKELAKEAIKAKAGGPA